MTKPDPQSLPDSVETGVSTPSLVVLPYAPGRRHWRLDVIPMRRRTCVLLFVIATWPFLITVTLPEALDGRPGTHIAMGLLTTTIMTAAVSVRNLVHTDALPTMAGKRLKRIQTRWVLLLSTAFIALHAAAVPLWIMFVVHYPLFSHARGVAETTQAPGVTTTRGWIGLFPVSSATRGHDGEVVFNVGMNGQLKYDPTPGTRFRPFGNPEDSGFFLGSWRWETTD